MNWIITASNDGSVIIWDFANQKEICQIWFMDSDNWIITSQDGFYDATPHAGKYVCGVKNNEIIEPDQMKIDYFSKENIVKLLNIKK